jgi:alkanesulfonate monooxygenase SsuD/methylene tetrahydromethanopterin reductase-like flavin-dependent oxidoreductase (luciferase family)
MTQERDRPCDTEMVTSRGAVLVPASIALLPVSVVAVGSPEQPVDRLMALQSATARGVHMVTQVARIRLSLPLHGWPSLRFR